MVNLLVRIALNKSLRVIHALLMILIVASCSDNDKTEPAATQRPTTTVSETSDNNRGNKPPSNTAGNESATLPAAAPNNILAALSYHETVAPIINDKCVMCHKAGGIAPFSLETYEQVAAQAPAVREATSLRHMPPWLPESSGSCQVFRDDRSLSQEQIDTIGQWVEQGAEAGTPPATPPPAKPVPTLDRVDAALTMQAPYTPVARTESPEDDYRCFIMDPNLGTDRFLTGYQVNPGNTAMVHHMILFSLNNDNAQQQAAELDAADPEPGYACFGGSKLSVSDASVIAAWAPGVYTTQYPAGTGLKLSAGKKLVMQVHYNLAAGQGSDMTGVDLKLEDSVNEQANVVPLPVTDMELPPGQPSVSVSGKTPPLFTSYRIHGVFPHMHTLATSMEIRRKRWLSSANDCLVNIPRWDFRWQQFYFYQDAVRMGGRDYTKMTCTFDTTSRTETVKWGEGTQDEMCLNFFYVTGIADIIEKL